MLLGNKNGSGKLFILNWIIIILILPFLFISFVIKAESRENRRSLTFDSRYIQMDDQQYDIRGFVNFGRELSELRGWGLDTASDSWANDPESIWGRSFIFIGSELVLGFLMEESFLTSYHEISHASRFAAMGIGYELNGGGDEFFDHYFSNFGDSSGFTRPTKQNFVPKKNPGKIGVYGNLTPASEVIVSGAGMNAEMAYASYLQSYTYYHGGHVSYAMGYMLGKLSAAKYADEDKIKKKFSNPRNVDLSNDKTAVSYYYKKMGINISENDLDQANYLAFFLSSSTWRYFKGIYDYIDSGDTSINSWEFEGFRIPDFDSYITSKGLSLKMHTGYRFSDDLSLPVAIEHVYKGESATEYTIGLRKVFPVMKGLAVQGSVIAGYGQGYALEAELALNDTFSVFAGGQYDEFKSLNGERYIPSLKEDVKYWGAYGGLRLRY